VSEYQYYEFLAIDKPLGEREQQALRAISKRAHITASSFTNTYNWGDLKADPQSMLMKYFDAFVYVANWGTRQLMLRIPRRFLDEETVAPFCATECVDAATKGDFTILDFSTNEDDGDDGTGEGWMASLIPLRADLMAGDLRCLYLGWLLAAQNGLLEEDEAEPSLPAGCPGLRESHAPLEAFANFLGIDSDLIEAAVEGLPAQSASAPSAAEMKAWIHSLSEGEKEGWLFRLADGGEPNLRLGLLKQCREAHAEPDATEPVPRRTVGGLLKLRDARAEERKRRAAQKRAADHARRAREREAERQKRLGGLVGREAALWDQIEALIAAHQAKKYEEAVDLVRDLADLAARQGTAADFRSRYLALRDRHSTKRSLLARLNDAGIRV
jgi:hypothetical protein